MRQGDVDVRLASVATSLLFLCAVSVANAGSLTFISDTILNSAPSATSSHIILFTTATAIPENGRITITPEQLGGNNLIFSALLDYTDVDVAVATTGPAIERSLAATPSATNDGVTFVSGSSGSITITLASDPFLAIPLGAVITIKIGSVAVVGSLGDEWIQNPSFPAPYRINFETRNASNVLLDSASTFIVIIPTVTLGPANTTNPVPPTRSGGLPSGLLPGSTLNVLISLNTDILATCRYATSSGVTYSLSSPALTSANLGLLHYLNIPATQNTVYNFYIRCANSSGTANTDDYLISYEVGVVPNAATPPPPAGPSGPSGPGGGGGNFLGTGEVTIAGQGIPLSNLVILKDGIQEREEQISSLGTFNTTFTSLSRGTYTWGVYMRDPSGRRSAIYNSTIYLIGGTTNIIAPVYLSPTMSAKSTTTPVGGNVVVGGYAIALTPVMVIMNKQGEALTGKIISATTTAAGNGSWSIALPTTGLTKGTYEIKAQSIISNREQSNLSSTLYVGIGEDPNPNFFNRSDLNKDKKVNLVDFSILLFNWKTDDAVADINQDGTVNLVDFSIMLANWTS